MSRYFVTSQPTTSYPYTFEYLRARPPRKRKTGLLLLSVAFASALCGGAVAFAYMATADEPALVRVASLDTVKSDATEMAAADVEGVNLAPAEPTKAEPVIVEPVRVETVKIVGEDAAMMDPAPLAVNNPRWADDPFEQSEPAADEEEFVAAPLSDIAIAESEEEVIALEEEMNSDLTTGAIAYAEPEEDEPVKPAHISAPAFATSDLVPARATRYVNMRVGRDKYAAKMLVVPQDAEISADPECRHWCRVVYDGRLGYVYRTYIRFPGEAAVAARQMESLPSEKTETSSEQGFMDKLRQGFRRDP